MIGVGFTEIQAMATVAKQYPNTHFAIVDVSNADEGGAKNVQGLLFKEQEVGYLAGYAAGLAAKARGGTAVSTVGGEKQPPVDRYIAGFQAGAKAAFPGVKTLNGYSQDFTVQAKCKELALNQIAAGSVVVFQVAGGCGLGALDAAKEKGVWGVGVDADQGFLGTYILTSALKGVDKAVYLSIKDAKNGNFQGGKDTVYGLDEKGVGLGKFSPLAPKGIEAKTKQIEAQIISGKIKNIPTTVPSRTSLKGRAHGNTHRQATRPAEGQELRRRRDGRRGRALRRRASSGSTRTARTSSSTRRTRARRAATSATTRG